MAIVWGAGGAPLKIDFFWKVNITTKVFELPPPGPAPRPDFAGFWVLGYPTPLI